MIHLMSPRTNVAFCGNMTKSGDVLTAEHPPDREVGALCKMCRRMYNQHMLDERMKREMARNNRSSREKLHDWLEQLASIGSSDMEAIYYPMMIVMTLGTVIPGKHIAKLLLKAGI